MIFVIILIISCYRAYAQNNKVVWQQCIGDYESAYHYSATKISDGYFLTLGINSGEGVTNYHGSADIWLIRTDSLHNVLWEKCYGGSYTDNPRKIVPITDSTFYIFGSAWSVDGDVQSGTNGFNDVWVVKINGQGDILWEKTYGSPYYDEPNDLEVTPDGGFVFINRFDNVGGDISQFYGAYDVWMCKCDADGIIEWEKTLGSEGLDNGVSLIINRRGNIMMVGAVQYHGGMVTCFPEGAIGNVWLVELDMQGYILWQECYGGSDYEAGMNIIEVDDGYIFVGTTLSNDGDVSGHHPPSGLDGKPDIWLVKIDTLGAIVWQKCLGGSDWDYSRAVFTTNAGEILVFGETTSNDGDVSGNHSFAGNVDVWLARLDANGVLLGQQCFGGNSDERLNTHSVSKIADYRYIIASQTARSSGDVICTLHGEIDIDAWFFEIKDCDYYAPSIPTIPDGPVDICTSSSNQTKYTTQPATNSQGYLWELYPTISGSISQTGSQATVSWNTSFKGTAYLKVLNFNDCGSSAWSDTLHIQVKTCLGINELVGDVLKVYPNPSSEYVVFEAIETLPVLSLPGKPQTISITDIYGRIVAQIPVTDEQTVWQTGKVKPGVYLYHLNNSKYITSGKLMIIK